MQLEYILRKSLGREPHCANTENREAYLRTANSYIDNMGWSAEYAEPGYTQPKRGILFSNWNYFSAAVTDLLEKYGYAIEWEDEWSTCSNCSKAFRTSPDSYGWQPSYFETDGDMLCKDCIDMESYLETLENDPRRALNDHINPADYGYVRLEDSFENGFHPHQTDNPKTIFDRLQAEGHKRLLFNVDAVGQFDIRFSVWEKVQS